MRAPCTCIFWGTYLRLADLRHRLANIIVAVPRSIESRRVVEHSGAVHRHRARGVSRSLQPGPVVCTFANDYTRALVLARLKIKPRPCDESLDKPFHIIARYALGLPDAASAPGDPFQRTEIRKPESPGADSAAYRCHRQRSA